MTALIQNFSVPADNDVAVPLKVDPQLGLESLEGTIYWRAYEEKFGIPVLVLPSGGDGALIEKSSVDGSITVGSPATACAVQIQRADTVNLLRNYYHETTLVDLSGNVSTLNCGIMTITDTKNRP